MIDTKPILVTGSHRSGSTWVGKMLATSPSVNYIHEPFNGMCRPGICSSKFPYTFMYITEANESNYYNSVKDILQFSYNFEAETKTIKTLKDIARMYRDYMICKKNKLLNVTPLIKDPMAIFSAEWLANKFDMNVLILVRHPASFVSSCKQLGWGFDFSHLLKQKLLIKDYLYLFETEINDYASKEHDLIDKCALLWKIIYYVVKQYRQKYNGWLFVKYEDICENPLKVFESIFQKTKIKYTRSSIKVINKYTFYPYYKGIKEETHSVKRHSKLYKEIWKYRLTKPEITRIRNQVESISQEFYSSSDWN